VWSEVREGIPRAQIELIATDTIRLDWSGSGRLRDVYFHKRNVLSPRVCFLYD